jgi:nucleoid-associated protein YgaU
MLARMLRPGVFTPPAAVIALSLLAAGCANSPTAAPQSIASDPTSGQQTDAASAPLEEHAAPDPEPVVELKSTAPERYVVVDEGDTLWDIASHFLKDPWYWPEIWHVNPQIDNPHLIYPGDVLTLFYVNGKPYIQVGDGPPSA